MYVHSSLDKKCYFLVKQNHTKYTSCSFVSKQLKQPEIVWSIANSEENFLKRQRSFDVAANNSKTQTPT